MANAKKPLNRDIMDFVVDKAYEKKLTVEGCAAYYLILEEAQKEKGDCKKAVISNARFKQLAKRMGGSSCDSYSALNLLKGRGIISDFLYDYPQGRSTAYLN